MCYFVLGQDLKCCECCVTLDCTVRTMMVKKLKDLNSEAVLAELFSESVDPNRLFQPSSLALFILAI